MSKSQEVVKCIQGLNKDFFTQNEIVDMSGASTALVYNVVKSMVVEGKLRTIQKGKKKCFALVDSTRPAPEKIDIPVNERFEYIEKFTRMVAQGHSPSFLLTGQAGVGKTHIVVETLKSMDLKENDDFVIIKGHASPMGLYRSLYHNLDKIIVLDDADSVWSDSSSVNLLKGALDSYDKRTISWMSLAADRNGLPDSFDFEGSIIFISNIDAARLDSAVVSRTITANLVMTNDEIIDRMEAIAPDVEKKIPVSIKKEVIDFLREKQVHFDNLSLRTFIQASRIRMGNEDGWKNMVLWTCK